MEVWSYIVLYFAAINLAGFLSMAMDKSKARRNKWRIPEATLFLFAVFGGSLGCLLGMRIFRHKTQKPKFYIGIPIILGIQIVILIWFFFIAPLRFRVL